MLSRKTTTSGLAAIAAVMLLATAGPLSAFTLSSPSVEQPFVKAPIEHVWWDRWGRWHPNGWDGILGVGAGNVRLRILWGAHAPLLGRAVGRLALRLVNAKKAPRNELI
jgi:hypothetical protein